MRVYQVGMYFFLINVNFFRFFMSFRFVAQTNFLRAMLSIKSFVRSVSLHFAKQAHAMVIRINKLSRTKRSEMEKEHQRYAGESSKKSL